jgi:hypothetical protein
MGYCNDCKRTWRGESEAHCSICCAHFTSDDAFDAHLAPSRSDEDCYDPATLKTETGEPRFVQVQRAQGPVWMRHRPNRKPMKELD